MKILKSELSLDKMRFFAYHGVLKQENVVGGSYTVDLNLVLSNIDKAIYCDELVETVNYAEVYECVKMEMKQNSKLLEHLAGRIVSSLFDHFERIVEIKITITKDVPPMSFDGRGVSYSLTARRK